MNPGPTSIDNAKNGTVQVIYSLKVLTFIMSTIVLRAIMIMIEYSNGGETTNFHILY